MTITIELPQGIEEHLQNDWSDLERHALEGFVTEAFRNGKLSSQEVAQILKLDSHWEAIHFLSERGAYPGYDLEDLEEDRHAIERVETEPKVLESTPGKAGSKDQDRKFPSALGKYAFVGGGSQAFAKEKQEEIKREDRPRG